MIDMNKSLVVMHLFILSTIQGSWLVVPPTHPTPWMHQNSELTMESDNLAAALIIGFLERKSLSQ